MINQIIFLKLLHTSLKYNAKDQGIKEIAKKKLQ